MKTELTKVMHEVKKIKPERIKERYPVGCKVRVVYLKRMPELYGTGVVTHVDDDGRIYIKCWNGAEIVAIYGKDYIKRILNEKHGHSKKVRRKTANFCNAKLKNAVCGGISYGKEAEE